MSKILIVVDDFINISNKAGATMVYELALEFQKNNYQVTIITPSFRIKKNYKISFINDIQIVEFKSSRLKNISRIKRGFNELVLSLIAYFHLRKWLNDNPHNFIIYYSPTIFFGFFIKFLKKIWRAKSYLILRDVFPQWAIDSGILREKSLITIFFKFFEKINYSSADKIGMMSENNVRWFKEKFGKANVEVLYNWTSVTNTPKNITDYKKILKIEDKIVLFYGGNIGHAQDMNNLMNLVHRLKNNSKVHVCFCRRW